MVFFLEHHKGIHSNFKKHELNDNGHQMYFDYERRNFYTFLNQQLKKQLNSQFNIQI